MNNLNFNFEKGVNSSKELLKLYNVKVEKIRDEARLQRKQKTAPMTTQLIEVEVTSPNKAAKDNETKRPTLVQNTKQSFKTSLEAQDKGSSEKQQNVLKNNYMVDKVNASKRTTIYKNAEHLFKTSFVAQDKGLCAKQERFRRNGFMDDKVDETKRSTPNQNAKKCSKTLLVAQDKGSSQKQDSIISLVAQDKGSSAKQQSKETSAQDQNRKKNSMKSSSMVDNHVFKTSLVAKDKESNAKQERFMKNDFRVDKVDETR